jgi:phosphate starvation-inducible protein PhoH
MTRRKPSQTTTEETTENKNLTKKDFINSVVKKKQKNKFLSDNQKEYYDLLLNNQITVCSGPAGVGKSFIAMKAAVDLLMDSDNSYEKIIRCYQSLKNQVFLVLNYMD